MLTREEANEFISLLTNFNTGTRMRMEELIKEFTEKSKPQRQTSREKVITILQILIDVLALINADKYFPNLSPYTGSINTASELLEEIKEREREMKAHV